MIDVASAQAAFSTFGTDVGTILLYAVGIVLTGAAALIGLGFAYRKVKSKVTGRKF